MAEPEQTLNILYLLPELNVGGVETHVTALSTGMTRLGHRVTIVSNGGALVKRLEAEGIEHVTMPVHRKSPMTINEMAGRVRRLIQERGVQVVHAHSRVPAWIAYLAARRLRTAFIISAHGQYAPHVGSKVMALGDRIICVSGGILDHMAERLRADRDRMLVIYNGVNIEQAREAQARCRPPEEVRAELGLPPDAPVIASIGRLTATKGLRFFIEAFHKLKAKKPALKGLLVGDGPIRKDLQDRAAELGVGGDLVFTGVRTDIYDILQIVDVYVVSSLYEGFPMGCLEAMASRVPIVATRVGGIPEMVEHERTALLVDPRDADALASQVDRLVDDAALRDRLTAEAYDDVVHRFSEEKMLGEVLDVYYDTLRRKRGYIGPVRGVAAAERPRVLLTLPELRVGGVETHMVDLAHGLKLIGYKPLVVSFGGKLVDRLAEENIDHVKLPVHSKNPLVIRNMIGPMRSIISDHRIELVHAHSRVPAWISFIALKTIGRRVPFITTCHSTYSIHIGSRVMNWSDRMIAVSEFVLNHMLTNFGTSPDKITVVHNGISPDIYDEARAAAMAGKYREELGIGRDEKVVGMVASLTPRKGYAHFIEAAGKIAGECGGVRFIGVGGGPQRDELEAKVREAGLDGRFSFLGVRTDVRDLLSAFDVFVLSSYSEGLPYVILEAMGMKKPIVTTDVGGIPEAVTHGGNGLLVKPGDCEALARSIMELLGDEEMRLRLGGAARREVVENFNVDRMVSETEKIYRLALG